MRWIEINVNSKLTKIGHKVRNFEELVKLNPEFILEAMDKDNRIILLDDCITLLNEQCNKKVSKEKLRTIKIILERNKYRQERLANENAAKIVYTDSDDILMGNGYTIHSNWIVGIMTGV